MNDNNQKMKIVFCTNTYPPNFIGGAELIAHSQAKMIKQLGNEVIVFTGETQVRGKRYSIKKENYDGLTVYRVYLQPKDYQSDLNNFAHRKVEEHFKELLDNFSPDVVHFHNIIGLSVGIIHIAKSRGIKTVLTVHDHWGFCYKNTILKNNGEICQDFNDCDNCTSLIQDDNVKNIPIGMRKDFFTMQMNDVCRFISPSQYLANAYIQAGIPGEKFRVIWYGINTQRFTNLSKTVKEGIVRFTFIGYFGEHKGVHVILNALPLITSIDRVRINLVGFGDQTDNYKKQVKNIGREDFVRFWGKIDNRKIEEVYSETDVLILPSIWPENQPVTILEAMTAKIPVIASSLGGIPELVEEGETGYLFEAGNANQLARKMSEFLLHPERIQIFGENAFKKITDYSLENQVDKIIKVYKEEMLDYKNKNEEYLIVCIGRSIDPECSRAMNAFLKESKERIFRFAMKDWLQEDQVRKAKLLWVVDKKVNQKDVKVGLVNRVPLLVPENNKKLKKLCIKGNCGLYYKDFLEAQLCLEYLTNNEEARIVLGQNGFKIHNNI